MMRCAPAVKLPSTVTLYLNGFAQRTIFEILVLHEHYGKRSGLKTKNRQKAGRRSCRVAFYIWSALFLRTGLRWERMTDGDREKLIAELVGTRLPALVLFARQWKHDSAEDIVQEAFIRLMRLVEPPQDPVGWLFAAVRNASNQHLRAEKRRRCRENASLAEKKPWFGPCEGENELVAELESLPLDYRTVIVAKIWGNLTFEQIAAMTGSSRSSAHRKYNEGLALLKKRLEEP